MLHSLGVLRSRKLRFQQAADVSDVQLPLFLDDDDCWHIHPCLFHIYYSDATFRFKYKRGRFFYEIFDSHTHERTPAVTSMS